VARKRPQLGTFDRVSALTSHIGAPKGKFIKFPATDIESEVEEDDIPEGTEEETPIKTKRRAPPAAKKLESPSTDIEEPTPEKKGRGLKRTYAMADITAKNGSDSDFGDLDINYEPPADLDPTASGTESGGIAYEADDAEETPKAKKKVSRPASKVIRGNAGGKKSEVRVNVTGDETESEAKETPKTKKMATKQATKTKGKAAGKKPEVTEASDTDGAGNAEETPKAKKRGKKQAVREAINAYREEPAGKKQEVSFQPVIDNWVDNWLPRCLFVDVAQHCRWHVRLILCLFLF